MRWEWTALAKEARKAINARRGEVDGKSVKKGQHQNQDPTPSKDAVCRHCSKTRASEHRMLVES